MISPPPLAGNCSNRATTCAKSPLAAVTAGCKKSNVNPASARRRATLIKFATTSVPTVANVSALTIAATIRLRLRPIETVARADTAEIFDDVSTPLLDRRIVFPFAAAWPPQRRGPTKEPRSRPALTPLRSARPLRSLARASRSGRGRARAAAPRRSAPG